MAQLLCSSSLCPRVQGAVEYALLDGPLSSRLYEPSSICDPRFEMSHAENRCHTNLDFLYAMVYCVTVSLSAAQHGEQCTISTVVLYVCMYVRTHAPMYICRYVCMYVVVCNNIHFILCLFRT